MIQTKNIVLSIIASFAISINFGFWMENIFAGIFAFLISYYAFMFRYDDD